jgi:hypothetical protein
MHLIAIAIYVRTNPKLKRELRRIAPQLSFGFYVFTEMAIAIVRIDIASWIVQYVNVLSLG